MYVVLGIFKKLSSVFLTSCNLHLVPKLQNFFPVKRTALLLADLGLGNLPGTLTRDVCHPDWQKPGCLEEGSQAHPWRPESQLRGVGPALHCCQPNAPELSASILLCLNVFTGSGTTLIGCFIPSDCTKCLSKLAFGRTSYNPIKHLTARQGCRLHKPEACRLE